MDNMFVKGRPGSLSVGRVHAREVSMGARCIVAGPRIDRDRIGILASLQRLRDSLVKELRLAGISTVAAANAIPNGLTSTVPCPKPSSVRSARLTVGGTDPVTVDRPATS